MRNDWILDVLADLKTFARANGLVALAEQLEEASHVAACEMASGVEGVAFDAKLETPKAGQGSGGPGESYRI